MRVVYKYPLLSSGPTLLELEGGNPKVLFVGGDPNGEICLWAEVGVQTFSETSGKFGPAVTRVEVVFIGTGHEVPDGYTYINSVNQGPFVWHFYQKGLS